MVWLLRFFHHDCVIAYSHQVLIMFATGTQLEDILMDIFSCSYVTLIRHKRGGQYVHPLCRDVFGMWDGVLKKVDDTSITVHFSARKEKDLCGRDAAAVT